MIKDQVFIHLTKIPLLFEKNSEFEFRIVNCTHQNRNSIHSSIAMIKFISDSESEKCFKPNQSRIFTKNQQNSEFFNQNLKFTPMF